MQTDGIFTTRLIEIPFENWNQEIVLWATGDWHRNSPAHDKEKFEEFLEDAQGDYILGVGDYLDSISTSERKAFKSMSIHDSTIKTIENLYEKYVDELADLLKNVKVLGLCGGNHYYEFSYGLNTDSLLCKKIGCPYLGVNSIIRLLLRHDKTHAHAVDIVIHHGQGGCRTSGASINKVERMAMSFNADIILQGHDHNRSVDYINRLGLSSNHILENKKILLARTGSFLRSYEENMPSYAVDAAYAPSDLGALKISITPRRKKDGKEDRRFVEIKATI